MGAPITRLPPELLALTFEHLEPPERTLCTMTCQNWQRLTSSLWPALETNSNELRAWAAETENPSAMKFAKKYSLPKTPPEFVLTEFGDVLKSLSKAFNFECDDYWKGYNDGVYHASNCRFITSELVKYMKCLSSPIELSQTEVASMPLGSLDPADQDVEFASFDLDFTEGYLIVTRKSARCAWCGINYLSVENCGELCCESQDGEMCEWFGKPGAPDTSEKFKLHCQLIPQIS